MTMTEKILFKGLFVKGLFVMMMTEKILFKGLFVKVLFVMMKHCLLVCLRTLPSVWKRIFNLRRT